MKINIRVKFRLGIFVSRQREMTLRAVAGFVTFSLVFPFKCDLRCEVLVLFDVYAGKSSWRSGKT